MRTMRLTSAAVMDVDVEVEVRIVRLVEEALQKKPTVDCVLHLRGVLHTFVRIVIVRRVSHVTNSYSMHG
jgi:hypothetical protein